MIKNIIFDVGNVLVDFNPVVYMKKHDYPEEVINLFEEMIVKSPIWNDLDESIRPINDIIGQFKGLVPGYEKYIDLFFNDLPEICWSYDYSSNWLKSLQDRNYKTFIISNYPDDLWDLHEKERFNFIPFLDGKIISGKVKLIKPNPAIYKLLMENYSLKAEECVFIDDREENVRAAEKLGIKGIIFKDKASATEQLERLLAE